MKVEYAIRLTGSQNIREHWRARSKRVKAERSTAELVCRASLERPTCWPVVVRLTRIGPRKLDSDNVAGACKATRDGVADWLGVDDGDESKVRWVYAQDRGPYGVRVEVLSEPVVVSTAQETELDLGDGVTVRFARATFVVDRSVDLAATQTVNGTITIEPGAELTSADPADVATWDEVLP